MITGTELCITLCPGHYKRSNCIVQNVVPKGAEVGVHASQVMNPVMCPNIAYS